MAAFDVDMIYFMPLQILADHINAKLAELVAEYHGQGEKAHERVNAGVQSVKRLGPYLYKVKLAPPYQARSHSDNNNDNNSNNQHLTEQVSLEIVQLPGASNKNLNYIKIASLSRE